VGRLELEGVVLFPAVRLVGGEAAIHADDLERLLLEVVRLLRVEGEDLEGDLGSGTRMAGTISFLSFCSTLRRWLPFGVQ
jgi:hypothetical protein